MLTKNHPQEGGFYIHINCIWLLISLKIEYDESMNKQIIIGILACILLAALVYISTTLDKETPATNSEPVVTVPDNTEQTVVYRTGDLSNQVTITSPEPAVQIASPVLVSGQAPGNWFFEGTAPVSVTNWDGLIVGEGYVMAEDDWMTTELVDFSGSVEFQIDESTVYNRGSLILRRSNASGLPEFDAAVEIPIVFSNI